MTKSSPAKKSASKKKTVKNVKKKNFSNKASAPKNVVPITVKTAISTRVSPSLKSFKLKKFQKRSIIRN